MSALRPHPHRGDALAAGAVVLALGVAVADLRLAEVWAEWARLAILSGPAALLVATMAVLSPVEERPRPSVTVLVIAGLGLVALALSDLADALGDGGRLASPAATAFVAGAVGLLCLLLAPAKRSATATLAGGLAATVLLLAVADLSFELDDRLEAFRYLLLAAVVALMVAAVLMRDRHRRHAVAFVEAGGLALLAVGVTLAAERMPELAPVGPLAQGTPVGWEAVLLLGGGALLAYGALDRERGPASLGAAALALFTGLVGSGEDASLLWWPLGLLAGGVVLVALALRPAARPAPEPPPPWERPPAAPAPPPARAHEPPPWEQQPSPVPAEPDREPPHPPSPLWSGGQGGHER